MVAMAQCANCNKKLRDGFVFVPVDDVDNISSSDAYRKSRVFDLASDYGNDKLDSNICSKCIDDLAVYVDGLITKTEGCNTSYIKFMTDAGLPIASTVLVFPTQCFIHSLLIFISRIVYSTLKTPS